MHLLDLPDDMLVNILEHLRYSEVSRIRGVCKAFNVICEQVLKSGLNKAVHMLATYKALPKEICERNKDPDKVCLHCELLSGTQNQINQMSVMHGNFIPGNKLDKIFGFLLMFSYTHRNVVKEFQCENLKVKNN